jgi:cell division protein FtsB
VEYSRSHPLTKIVVIALILVCTAALITLSISGYQLKREIALLREEAAFLAAENAELRRQVEFLREENQLKAKIIDHFLDK